ncbi:aspartyl-phosphate phosphatase Spo0E family protein [Paenibacillus doosanensis]|uniref:Spo0E like sporulation regulatory protein n=1 Tax=Paenibacillus konkukensis TaxID=2020716 RepID=A0ABY4RIZ8_9BACL|nr:MULTISPECIES: aspartyl-phosphate phosphatase Spo0E family protein [Paenibacillus]MCS7464671.1 aspartyl-phosphate phosphatase Spo0E family protein [Paenibacillus doosanensis]UQZ81523.1 Spo0E like sporulation regulatory protein [Paenibacillus konkukensis]
MDESQLKQHMEQLQKRLYRLVEQTGSLVDPQVVELSQQLDHLVVTLQRRRMSRKRTSLLKNRASF